MPVHWDTTMNEKLLLAIINCKQHPDLKSDGNKVAEKLGQGLKLKAGAVQEHFHVLRVQSSQTTNPRTAVVHRLQ